MYQILKHFHLLFIVLSVSLLIIRFVWMLSGSAQLDKKWVKVLPHVIDTGLLLSALGLCLVIAQYPFIHLWLTEKLIAVIAYICMGVMCYKGRTRLLRMVAFVGAIGWLGLIGHLAITKTPVFLG